MVIKLPVLRLSHYLGSRNGEEDVGLQKKKQFGIYNLRISILVVATISTPHPLHQFKSIFCLDIDCSFNNIFQQSNFRDICGIAIGLWKQLPQANYLDI